MKRIIILSALVLSTAMISEAAARPDTRRMSCDQVQDLLENGATVLTTGTHTYDRYVSQFSSQCRINQEPRRSSVPTADRDSCPVYRCEPVEYLFERGGRDR